MEFIQEIKELLRDESVRNEMVLLAAHVTDPIEQLFEMGLVSGVTISPREDLFSVCAKCLTHFLANRLSQPPVVVGEDLVEPFFAAFSLDEDDDREKTAEDLKRALATFVTQLETIPIAARQSPTMQLGTGSFVAVQNGNHVHSIDPVTIFKAESGFAVKLFGILPAADEDGRRYNDFFNAAWIQIEAHCTPKALKAAIAEMRSALSTLIKCGVLLSEARAQQFFALHLSETSVTDDEAFSAEATDESPAEDSSVDESPEDEPVEEGLIFEYMMSEGYFVADGQLGPWFRFIPDCLEAYFFRPTKPTKKGEKDSIPRRLKTATRLLAQAEMQASNGVGLALSVAAIEAMLCKNEPGLAAMFADNAATLLEPLPEFRADAFDCCKKLYDLRSRILHGSSFDAMPVDLSNARLLAAAVLKAMIERRNFRRRMEQPGETPDELIKEMAKDKYTPGQTTGVEDSPIVAVWRA